MKQRRYWFILWVTVSSMLISISLLIPLFNAQVTSVSIVKAIILLLIAQVGSCILFPLLVGFFYDRVKQHEDADNIWTAFRDLAEGGIVRVYKDREENEYPDNAFISLKSAFDNATTGEVKLVGVSLRVFFNQTGPFYRSIYKICSLSEETGAISIKALLSHLEAPETTNRAKIETPEFEKEPLIAIDISSTVASIGNLNRTFPKHPIEHRFYREAPYCTCIIFPDRCYFSPNLLSTDAPVRLPMIVFRKGSHGYAKLNSYFDYLWRRVENHTERSNGNEQST